MSDSTYPQVRLKMVTKCLDSKRVPLNATERSYRKGPYPYWGATGVLDYVDDYLFDEELVLLGEDGAPFFDKYKDVAFHAHERVWVNNHAHVLRVTSGEPRFVAYALNTVDYSRFIVGSTRDKLTQDRMDEIRVPNPRPSRQRTIARYLDKETARIGTLISKKKRQIELLNEKRAAIITRAVTKGLDPEAKMKDSGVEWIGEIPESWDVVGLRRVMRRVDQGWSPQADSRPAEDGEWGVLKVGAVYKGAFRRDQNKALPSDVEPNAAYEVHDGDLLVTRGNTRELVADSCIVHDAPNRLMMSDLHYRLKLDDEQVRASFVNYWLTSKPGRHQIERDAHGTSGSMVKVSQGQIASWVVPVPPIQEQERIVALLDDELSHASLLRSKIEFSIEYLQELRSSLITAAVSGQIDIAEFEGEEPG